MSRLVAFGTPREVADVLLARDDAGRKRRAMAILRDAYQEHVTRVDWIVALAGAVPCPLVDEHETKILSAVLR